MDATPEPVTAAPATEDAASAPTGDVPALPEPTPDPIDVRANFASYIPVDPECPLFPPRGEPDSEVFRARRRAALDSMERFARLAMHSSVAWNIATTGKRTDSTPAEAPVPTVDERLETLAEGIMQIAALDVLRLTTVEHERTRDYRLGLAAEVRAVLRKAHNNDLFPYTASCSNFTGMPAFLILTPKSSGSASHAKRRGLWRAACKTARQMGALCEVYALLVDRLRIPFTVSVFSPSNQLCCELEGHPMFLTRLSATRDALVHFGTTHDRASNEADPFDNAAVCFTSVNLLLFRIADANGATVLVRELETIGAKVREALADAHHAPQSTQTPPVATAAPAADDEKKSPPCAPKTPKNAAAAAAAASLAFPLVVEFALWRPHSQSAYGSLVAPEYGLRHAYIQAGESQHSCANRLFYTLPGTETLPKFAHRLDAEASGMLPRFSFLVSSFTNDAPVHRVATQRLVYEVQASRHVKDVIFRAMGSPKYGDWIVHRYPIDMRSPVSTEIQLPNGNSLLGLTRALIIDAIGTVTRGLGWLRELQEASAGAGAPESDTVAHASPPGAPVRRKSRDQSSLDSIREEDDAAAAAAVSGDMYTWATVDPRGGDTSDSSLVKLIRTETRAPPEPDAVEISAVFRNAAQPIPTLWQVADAWNAAHPDAPMRVDQPCSVRIRTPFGDPLFSRINQYHVQAMFEGATLEQSYDVVEQLLREQPKAPA